MHTHTYRERERERERDRETETETERQREREREREKEKYITSISDIKLTRVLACTSTCESRGRGQFIGSVAL